MVTPLKAAPPKVATKPVTTTVAPTKADAVAPTQLEPTKPASDFDATKRAKGGNLTGGFKPVASAKAGPANLKTDVQANRSAAAVNGAAAKPDAKVADAMKRLEAKTPATAKDLIAEYEKLSPNQQHALLVGMPDKMRLSLGAELKKLAPSQRGPQISWMGDKYVSVTVAPLMTKREDGGLTKFQYAEKVDLGGGKSITAKPNGGPGDLEVKMGNQTLMAEKVVGGWKFYETVKPGTPGSVQINGKNVRVVTNPTKDQQTMMAGFREGSVMANNISGQLDPKTEQTFRDRAIDAAIPGARKNLTKLSEEAAKWTGFAKNSAQWIAKNQEWLAPAVQGGHIAMKQGADGSVSLTLTRAEGMRDSEWKKLQTEFGPKVAQFQERLSKDQKWLATELSIRGTAANGALETFNGPSFQKYLSTLPPRERLDEVNRLAQSLKGSGAGVSLANELMGPDAFKTVNGKLEPSNEFAKTVFAGMNTPEARESLVQLALNLGPQVSGPGAGTLGRTLEVLRGKPLTAREREGVNALHNVTSQKEFETLIDPDQNESPSLKQKAGDISDLLAELGGASEADKLGSSTNKIAKTSSDALKGSRATAITTGSAIVATFQVYNSTKDLLQKGVTMDTAASFAEDATRVIGTWGSVMDKLGKTPWLVKAGKFAGPVSDAIGLVNDMRRESSSSEGGYRNNVHVGASALILAGGLAGGPIGVAGVLVGLGVKLFFDRTSESYENAHGKLTQLPTIQ